MHNEIQNIVESMLEQGVEDRDLIVDAASKAVDVDDEALRRSYFTRAVSFCIAHVRDELGKRLAYQVREGGKHIVVHLNHTVDYELVGRIARQKLNAAEALVAEGNRLQMIAEQIEIQFPARESA